MNHLLCGLAANPALPSDLVDRLIAVAVVDPDLDPDDLDGPDDPADGVAAELAERADLSRTQAMALVARVPESAEQLAREGRLTAADIDPATQPYAALALLHAGAGRPEWTRLLAVAPDPEIREKLAACPGLSPDVVTELAGDADVRVVAELALWTTRETAATLAGHPHAEVRRAVALNEATPPAVLAALLTGEGLPPATRCLVCDSERTPFVHDPQCTRPDCDLLAGAACDGSHESTLHSIQYAALSNPATPVSVAVGFAAAPSTLLRWALATRPDLPPAVCGLLAADPAPGVRGELAENPVIDAALMRTLATDPDPDVRRRLAHNPRLPLDVLVHLATTSKVGTTELPRIAAATPAEIEDLAQSPNAAARMLLAQRRDLPPEIAALLAADHDAKVAKSIAPHPGLTEARLRTMVDRHGAQVAAGVAANPDATPALLEHLSRARPPARKALREIADHRNATAPALLACLTDKRTRPVAACHPALPPEAVKGLLSDGDRVVAEAAAANPSLPRELMYELMCGLVHDRVL